MMHPYCQLSINILCFSSLPRSKRHNLYHNIFNKNIARKLTHFTVYICNQKEKLSHGVVEKQREIKVVNDIYNHLTNSRLCVCTSARRTNELDREKG
jgi:hypothetical protein